MTGEKLGIGAITFRILWFVIAGCWVLATALFAAYLAMVGGSDLDCPDPTDDSSFGTAQWSWVQLANKCTFTDTSWLVPGESVSFYSGSALIEVLGLLCVAGTLLLLGFAGFGATRKLKV